MDKINIGSCPICGGHDFSPLAANQYMCTQCGYVVTGSSDSSQAPTPSSDSSQDSSLLSDEEPVSEVNINQKRCPRCGSVVDKELNFCPNCGFRFSQEGSATTQTAEESQSPHYDEDEQEQGIFYKILKWIGIVIGLLFGGFLAFLLLGGLIEVCSTGKDSAMVDSVSVDSTEAKVVVNTWEQRTFDGVMYDEEGNLCNMQVTYETDGTNIRNCI